MSVCDGHGPVQVEVETPRGFMGDPDHYAMMGINKTIQNCYQVSTVRGHQGMALE